MLILFKAWKYTDEYYHLIETGVKTEEDDIDYNTDCYLDDILINPDLLVSVIPTEKIYTSVNDGKDRFLLNIEFKEFCKLTGYVSVATLKNKWAN